MANPVSPLNGQAETLDYVIGDDGIARLKRSVGSRTPTGAANPSANHAVVTHLAGSTIGATDEVVAAGAKDPTGNAQPLHVDAAGNLLAAAAPIAGSVRSTVITVGAVALLIPAAPLAGRRACIIQSAGSNTATIYLGGSAVTAGVTATGGLQLTAGQSIPIDLGVAVIYAVAGAAGQAVVILEVS